MNIEKLVYKLQPPCPKCPYTLGQVLMVTSPCPMCKLDGYKTYERLRRMSRNLPFSDEDDYE